MPFPSLSSVCSLALIKQKNLKKEGISVAKQQSKTQIPKSASPLQFVGRGKGVNSCEPIVPLSESCCVVVQNTSLSMNQTVVIKPLLVLIEKNLIRPIGSWLMTSASSLLHCNMAKMCTHSLQNLTYWDSFA